MYMNDVAEGFLSRYGEDASSAREKVTNYLSLGVVPAAGIACVSS